MQQQLQTSRQVIWKFDSFGPDPIRNFYPRKSWHLVLRLGWGKLFGSWWSWPASGVKIFDPIRCGFPNCLDVEAVEELQRRAASLEKLLGSWI